jgi:hypothetical protein
MSVGELTNVKMRTLSWQRTLRMRSRPRCDICTAQRVAPSGVSPSIAFNIRTWKHYCAVCYQIALTDFLDANMNDCSLFTDTDEQYENLLDIFSQDYIFYGQQMDHFRGLFAGAMTVIALLLILLALSLGGLLHA